eukprot:365302_1
MDEWERENDEDNVFDLLDSTVYNDDEQNDTFEYKKGNISSTQTIDKIHMTIAKAKSRVIKLDNCIGFCVEAPKIPIESKEYLIHFKEGNSVVQDHVFKIMGNGIHI